MSTIYRDQHLSLRELLAMAGKDDDATLLIPDLQRPYVWSPSQVTVLIDSLIRGWPFGTLLTWRVKAEDPARNLARSFWQVVDRTNGDEGQPISKKNPPATFHLVLDGQQRVQSLLLALGGDSWGFKLLDRQWHEQLSGRKPKGPRGKPHWSLGCLCVDIPALCEAYASAKSATAIDYTSILRWVITDDALGQSQLEKPQTYIEPLEKASESKGRFVRLARLWEMAPEQASIDPYKAEELASEILLEHGVSKDLQKDQNRPAGALLLALRDVKQTRVTYLELAEYESALGSREVYNDAIVNIFTRLNTAGRTLTREDITFAWLKIGWKTEYTNTRSARACIEELTEKLDGFDLGISIDDAVSAISFVWAVSFNDGKLPTNDDLMKGEAIRPMAANVSENWPLVVESAVRISQQLRDRGWRFRQHYQSVNSVAYLWAWYFAALRWRQDHHVNELEKDSLDKSLAEILNAYVDRWLICSQWAGVWAAASAQAVTGYAARLAALARQLTKQDLLSGAVTLLREHLKTEVSELNLPAANGLTGISADDRQQVRAYYTALWLWNRLDHKRWTMARIPLRRHGNRQDNLEVDHIVAWDLWQSKLAAVPAKSTAETTGVAPPDPEELAACVNEIGNCMLLEKNFNISKSNRPLGEFLAGVHEFKEKKLKVDDWARALELQMPQVDSQKTDVQALKTLFAERGKRIRIDLEQFIRGERARVDVPDVS